MAAPIIYTGENYARYTPSPGRAVQALGQLAQQKSYEREQDKRRAREDRDMLVEAMKLDPVYATSVEMNQEMAKEIDKWNDQASEIYQSLEGKTPTAVDMMKIQQLKEQTAAKIGQYKAWDDELQKAYQMLMSPQGQEMFDVPKFQEALNDFRTSKTRPVEGFLFQKVKNPIEQYRAYVNDNRGDVKYTTERITNKDGSVTVKSTPVYMGEEKTPEGDLISGYGASEMGQYNIQNWFDRGHGIPAAKKQQYIKDAGGDLDTAANMWFQDEVRGQAYPKTPTYKDERPRATSLGYGTASEREERRREEAITTEGRWENRDGAGYSVQESVNAPGIGNVRGIVINHGKYPERAAIQMDKDVFKGSLDEGTAFLEGNTVTVRPYVIADDGRVVFEVKGKKLEEVTDSLAAFELKKKGKLISKGGKDYKEVPADWGNTVIASWDDVKGKISSDTYNYKDIDEVYNDRFGGVDKWKGDDTPTKETGTAPTAAPTNKWDKYKRK